MIRPGQVLINKDSKILHWNHINKRLFIKLVYQVFASSGLLLQSWSLFWMNSGVYHHIHTKFLDCPKQFVGYSQYLLLNSE